ncbi:MAG: FAD-dependent monooxygenase [Clostridiales bacterium]|jgi:electron-transferring-flavoprotein dehydrogenase|nr:FAD-dependent monooxygenase [Clostridiales bacterium]
MEEYDVIIIGGASTGSYLARRLSKAGHSVLVIDKDTSEKVGGRYDIFHIAEPDFKKHNLPMPVAGEDLAFKFTGVDAYSAFGKNPKRTEDTIIGMHMHAYIERLNNWAKESGAKYEYESEFKDFLFEGGKISGAVYSSPSGDISAKAKLVADCSGIPSVARRKLPDGYGVENFQITSEEMFYVVLWYVLYENPRDYFSRERTWTFYKTWEAAQSDPKGAILGAGANLGFKWAEESFSDFSKVINLPTYKVDHIEKGTTPYRRPPYSFVADGFVVLGDAACLTKPHAGEGVTSSMVHADMVAEKVAALLETGKPLTKENLWDINKKYYSGQGKTFAGMLAMLIGAVSTTAKENDFFFEKDIIFSKKSFEAMSRSEALAFSNPEMLSMALTMLGGVVTGRLSTKTIGALLKAMGNSGKITALYSEYPSAPGGFDEWKAKADALWAGVGTMADVLAKQKGIAK